MSVFKETRKESFKCPYCRKQFVGVGGWMAHVNENRCSVGLPHFFSREEWLEYGKAQGWLPVEESP